MSVASSILGVHFASDDYQACAEHRLDSVNIDTKPGSAVSVVLASQGYPGSYPKGKQITVGAVPSSESTKPLHRRRLMESLQTSSSSMLGRRDLTTKSSHPEDESSRSQPTPKPFKLLCTLHIPQSKVSNSTAKRSVEILPIGHLLPTDTASRFSRVTLRALQSTSVESKSLTYADAGVSIDAGNSLVQRIKPFVRRTQRTGSNAEIGGFGGVFDLKATGYQDPVLVSGTDGVGTKLHVAVEAGIHGTVGEA